MGQNNQISFADESSMVFLVNTTLFTPAACMHNGIICVHDVAIVRIDIGGSVCTRRSGLDSLCGNPSNGRRSNANNG